MGTSRLRRRRELSTPAAERSAVLKNGGLSAQDCARSLIEEGFELADRGRRTEALGRFVEVIRTYGDEDDPVLQRAVVQCYTWAGKMAGQVGDTVQAHKFFDVALTQLSAIDDPQVEEDYCEAIIAKGDCLDGESRHMEALAIYDKLMVRHDAVRMAPVSLARGLYRRAIAASYVGLTQRAIDACDDFRALLKGNEHPEIRVFRAIVDGTRAGEIGISGHEEEALEEYRSLKARFAFGEDPRIDRELRSADEAIAILTRDPNG